MGLPNHRHNLRLPTGDTMVCGYMIKIIKLLFWGIMLIILEKVMPKCKAVDWLKRRVDEL
jgi:hypothetical protein